MYRIEFDQTQFIDGKSKKIYIPERVEITFASPSQPEQFEEDSRTFYQFIALFFYVLFVLIFYKSPKWFPKPVQFLVDIIISAAMFAVCVAIFYYSYLIIHSVLSGLWNIIITFLMNNPVLAIIGTFILCGMLTSKDEATKKAQQQPPNQKVPQVEPAASKELQCPICMSKKKDTAF